jgi:Glyoxalase/Bleomycin resistance protein/Dioxygenase superfamily
MTRHLTKLFSSPVQIAYAVADVDAAAHDWVETVGAGPFFVRRFIAVTEVIYRGKPASFVHTSAYGQWGNMMIELVQDHTLGPSVLTEQPGKPESNPSSKPRSAVRVHHVACLVDDFAKTLDASAEAGIEVAMSARARSTPFAFLDTVEMLGHFIEIYPRTASVTAFYALVADAAIGWSGTDPVRIVN